MIVTLVVLSLLVLLGVAVLAVGRHDQPPADRHRDPVKYYYTQRFAVWPTASPPRPIPYRSWRWQLGFGLVVYPFGVAGVIAAVWLVRFLSSR